RFLRHSLKGRTKVGSLYKSLFSGYLIGGSRLSFLFIISSNLGKKIAIGLDTFFYLLPNLHKSPCRQNPQHGHKGQPCPYQGIQYSVLYNGYHIRFNNSVNEYYGQCNEGCPCPVIFLDHRKGYDQRHHSQSPEHIGILYYKNKTGCNGPSQKCADYPILGTGFGESVTGPHNNNDGQ